MTVGKHGNENCLWSPVVYLNVKCTQIYILVKQVIMSGNRMNDKAIFHLLINSFNF